MESRLEELREFLPIVDDGLQRFFPFEVEELRDSGDKLSAYNVRGYASVYDSWSLDLGGFRERIMPGAFDDVLQRQPAVAHVWDHDTSKILSATWNDTLSLSSDTHGLQFYSRVAKTDYAKDLRVLLERRDIKEASFAFNVDEDGQEWRIVEEDGKEVIERDITKVSGLYDVTTCAMGAYPATTSALALRSIVRGRSLDAKALLVAEVQGEPQEALPAFQEIKTAPISDSVITTGSGGGIKISNVRVGTPQEQEASSASKGEIARLKREAEASAMVARERLFRRVS